MERDFTHGAVVKKMNRNGQVFTSSPYKDGRNMLGKNLPLKDETLYQTCENVGTPFRN